MDRRGHAPARPRHPLRARLAQDTARVARGRAASAFCKPSLNSWSKLRHMLEGCRRGVSGWVAWRLLLPALVAAPILANGCSDDVTRPGLASDCNDPECIEARGNGVPSTPPSSMSPGSA